MAEIVPSYGLSIAVIPLIVNVFGVTVRVKLPVDVLYPALGANAIQMVAVPTPVVVIEPVELSIDATPVLLDE